MAKTILRTNYILFGRKHFRIMLWQCWSDNINYSKLIKRSFKYYILYRWRYSVIILSNFYNETIDNDKR